jgi:predicted  nucleic acid-binding Zn-ribbon protein
MTTADFDARLNAMKAEIDRLPEEHRSRLRELAAATRSRHETVKRNFEEITTSLDEMRLATKYMAFDLEATRRENRELQSRLKAMEHGEE